MRRRRRTAESIPEASGRTRASLVAASYASTFSYAGTLSLAVALAAVTVVVSWPTLEAFWRAPQIGSFDGMSHLVVGEYYAGHIFPRTWGWAPYWFAGMPFPTFYPPLFYFSTALLYHILPFSYPAVAKSVLCLLLVALPGLSGSITWFHTRSFYAALATGCLTVAVLSDPHNTFGIAIAATLTRGLFTQLPGYVCLLLWCHLFLLAPCSRRSGYFSMFFLFLVLLSNVHVVPIVAALFLVVLFLDLVQAWRHRDLTPFLNSLGRHTVLGFIPLLAASFWYVPLMASSDYLVTMALPPMSAGHIATVWMVPGVLTAVATALSMARGARSIQAVALVCLLLAVISTLDSARFFPSLPIQPFRIFASLSFLSCVPIGYLFGRLIEWVSIPPLRSVAFVILMSPFAWALHAATSGVSAGLGAPVMREVRDFDGFVRTMHQDRRLTNVDVHSSIGDPAYIALNAQLASAHLGSTYSALRESSISAIFMTPLRNSLSEHKEAWGIDTFLAFDPDFLSQSLDQHLDRAEYMGVGHLVTASPGMAERLNHNPRVALEAVFGDWRAYALRTPAPTAEVLQREPAVFFGPAPFRKRSTWSYDYTRLQEEIFFRGRFDNIVARAHDQALDTSPDLDRFRTAIIADYRYRDLDRAYLRLKSYSDNNTLICIAAADPLFRRLSALPPSPNLHIVDRLSGRVEDIQPLRHQLQSILAIAARSTRGVTGAADQRVREVRLADGTIRVFLTGRAAAKMPILIRVSYFPYWRRVDSEEVVYMVTPTFMLTYADSDVALEFAADTFTWLGLSLSLLAVLSAGAILTRPAGRSPE